jgi:hypothetical protein
MSLEQCTNKLEEDNIVAAACLIRAYAAMKQLKVENSAQATFRVSFISLHAPLMDKHKQGGQNLARVFNCREM